MTIVQMSNTRFMSMKTQFSKNILPYVCLLLLILVSSISAFAQIPYATSGASYTQDFDNLYTTVPANNTTQAATVLPTGWEFVEAAANANTTLRNDNGSSGTGDTYLDGATSSNERAFGSYASGSLTSQFGASFINNTSVTLTQFTLSYTGEMWKDGGSATAVINKLAFAYAVAPTSLTVGTYTNVTNLDFIAPVNNNTADATKDGNLVANQAQISYTVTGISWAPGTKLYIRWTDANETGNDDNLAVDGLTFSAIGVPPPAITATSLVPSSFSTIYGTASSEATFDVSGVNITADITITPPSTDFELSTTSGGTFSDVLTISGTGTIATTPIYVRLKAIATAGTYSGNIVLSSTGATAVTVPISLSTVAQLAITTSGAVAQNKTYDGTDAAVIVGATPVGLVNGDVITVSGNGTFASANAGIGVSVTPLLSLSGTRASSYTLTQPVGLSADISPKGISITGLIANNKVFDGNTTATLSGIPSLVGVITADIPNVTLGGTPVANFTQSNVGSAIPVTVTGYTIIGTAANNYQLSQPTGLTADITTVASPTITSSTTATAIYGTVATPYLIVASNNPTSFNAQGLPNGLTIDTNNGEVSGTPIATPGIYDVTISATNTGGTGIAILTYTITTKALTVTATANNKTYDGTIAATFNGTLNGVYGNDDVVLVGTGTFASKQMGTAININSTATLSGVDAFKYTLTQPTGLTADISAKDVTVIGATAANKVYDGTTTANISGATLSGVIGNDDLSINGGGAFATAAAGLAKSITTAFTLSGLDAINYNIVQPNNLSADITPFALSISGLTGVNKTYDATTTATITGSTTLNGVIGTDDVSISGVANAAFATKAVGISKIINVTGFNLVGIDANNYTIATLNNVTADIAPAQLTVVGAVAQNKQFDGTTNATITGTLSGVIGSDVVIFVGTGVFASSAVGTNIAVTSTATLAGTDAFNYIISPQPTGLSANITAAPVVLAQWTIEPLQGTTANPTPNVGTGSAGVVGSMTGAATATGMNGTGCGAQVSGQTAWAIGTANPGTTNESSGVRFSTNTTGYQNIKLTWDQRFSNTSTNTVRLQYTNDGSVWTNFDMTAQNTVICSGSNLNNGRFEFGGSSDQYRRISVDLSSIASINNNANFGVRIVAAHYQATGQFRQAGTPTSVATAGTWRFDNVKFEGFVLSGPTAAVLSGTTAICQNGTTNLNVAITGGIAPYNVVLNDGTNNITINNYNSGTVIPVAPSATTTYALVSVTDANNNIGSGLTGTAIVTVNSLPAININSTNPVCGTTTLTAQGATTYVWNTGATIDNINVSPTVTTTYSVTGTDTNGCAAVNTQAVSPQICYPRLQAKVFLSHVDVQTLLMSNYMTSIQNFPLTDPYSSATYNTRFPAVNNTNVATTTPAVIAVTGNNAIVDWVFIELRGGLSGASFAVHTKAALLQSDGDIVDVDGVSPVTFPNITLGDYFITIRHRNHLGLRTLNNISFTQNPTQIDFTNNSVPLYGATPVTILSSNKTSMVGGDANFDGSIDAFDTIVWELQNGLFDDYSNNSDYNLDGSVDAFDSIIWELNNGKFEELD